jgi:hypothetical protein
MARLRSLLNDERARRAHVERQLAETREKLAVWREKAEQRAVRISRLTTPRARIRRLFGRGKAPAPPSVAAPAPPLVPLRTARLRPPAVAAVTAVTDQAGVALLGGLVTTTPLEEAGPDVMAGADLVAVAATTLSTGSETLMAWASTPDRTPLMVIADGSTVDLAPQPWDVLVGSDTDVRWRAVPALPSFRELTPVPATGRPAGVWEENDLVVCDPSGEPMAVLEGPGAAALALEHGVPILPDTWRRESDLEETLRRATVATRRRLWELEPHRVAHDLLAAVGIDVARSEPAMTSVLISNRPGEVGPALRRLALQRGVEQWVVVGLHGFAGGEEIRTLMGELGLAGEVVEMPAGFTLGRCMNEAMDRLTTPLWAKIDDDDVYGPHYLADAMVAIETTGADLVGKAVAYTYLEETDTTVLLRQGSEDAWGQFVLGATFVGRRGLWDDIKFAHRHARIDSTFLNAIRRAGRLVYSTTRDEYMVVRGAGAQHTWTADPARFSRPGDPTWPGRDDTRIVVD